MSNPVEPASGPGSPSAHGFAPRGGRGDRPTFPLSVHVLIMVAGALAVLAALLWVLTSESTSPLSRDPGDQTILEVIRLAFYAVAGLGGVIALTVAYRRQRIVESRENRESVKLFNERFAVAADQLSSQRAANRLAGVYAMAALADDWDSGRQTCINVLCAYVRMPYEAPPFRHEREEVRDPERFRSVLEERLIRHAVLNVVGGRLRRTPVPGRTWHEHDFDFTGANLDGGNLAEALFLGKASFAFARFTAGTVDFSRTRFEGSVDFNRARFLGGRVRFIEARFNGPFRFTEVTVAGGLVDFTSAEFNVGAWFSGTAFVAGAVHFTEAGFGAAQASPGAPVDFTGAGFSGCAVRFDGARLVNTGLDFSEVADWSRPPAVEVAEGREHVRLPSQRAEGEEDAERV